MRPSRSSIRRTGRARLKEYFEPYLQSAKRHEHRLRPRYGTWRANTDWGAKLDYSQADLDRINRDFVDFAKELRKTYETASVPIVINGVIGPRGDGYRADAIMTVEEAARYHRPQIEALRDAGADMVSAMTMNYRRRGVRASRWLPSVPACRSSSPLRSRPTANCRPARRLRAAVERLDKLTGNAPAYYMINCAHPEHFNDVLEKGAWLERIRGIRANASNKSHAELDASTELDIGDIAGLAGHYRDLQRRLPKLAVMGGCCGTDHRHIEAISDRCLAA